MKHVVIVGGSSGIGRCIAERRAAAGDEVLLTSRSAERANEVAAEIGPTVRGIGLDLSQPKTIARAVAAVAAVDHLVFTAIHQSVNTLRDFDVDEALTAITVKLVGYIETIRALRGRFEPGAAVVLFGGLAFDRPYPGSTIVTTHNGGVTGMLRTLAIELAPHRINVVSSGVVGDSPKWRDKPNEAAIARTPIGRLVTMAEVAAAVDFLLANTGVNAVELNVDGGYLVT